MNRMGIGAQVRIFKPGRAGQADSLLGSQEVSTGYGSASGQPAICHFGLSDETTVDVQITLPNGKDISRPGTVANQLVNVEEP